MEPRIFYYSKSRGIWMLLFAIVMTGIISFGLASDDVEPYKKILFGILLPMFVLLGISEVKHQIKPAINKVPALTLSETGIDFHKHHVIISWENLRSVEMIHSRNVGEVIYLYVKDIAAVTDQLPPAQRARKTAYFGDSITITPSTLAGSTDIFELIRKFYRVYGPDPYAIMFHRPGRETWPSE